MQYAVTMLIARAFEEGTIREDRYRQKIENGLLRRGQTNLVCDLKGILIALKEFPGLRNPNNIAVNKSA